MDYKVLYRKYRPNCFKNILGQDYSINILKNAIINDKIAHAYIFNGPRGTGKTSTAKVFAKTINCENPVDGEACGKCNSCINIKNNPDIIEIDAASNNGVDEIRELINNIKLSPSYSKYKVYIIDEVHMMTQSAFNALLLTLEEPPSHVVFILATTNIENVPITILSRCQKFDFKKISNEAIKENIRSICDQENIEITDDAVDEISYLSEGGMRDALSILDQLSSNNKKIDLDLIINNFGSVPIKLINNIIDSLDNNDYDKLKENIDILKTGNIDYKVFIKKMIDQLSKKAYENNKTLNVYKIKDIIFSLIEIINNYNINVNPFILIELTLLENINIVVDNSIENIDLLENTENKVNFNNKEDEKIISREIILEKNKEKMQNNYSVNNINNLSFDKKIRINNCFVNVNKKDKKLAIDLIDKIKNDYTNDNLLISMLIDSEVAAASDKVIILMNDLESTVNLINLNYKTIEDKTNGKKIVALTKDEWQTESKKYLENIKKGIKYNFIEEKEETNDIIIEDSVIKEETIEDVAKDIFGDIEIEVE